MAHQAKSPTLEELRERIRSKGLRVTAPRVAVLQSLGRTGAPASHAELAATLASQGWDRATIYRNLIDLTEAGLVSRTDLGDHTWRFEVLAEGRAHDAAEHPHFLCDACGDVLCLPDGSVQVNPARGAPRAFRKRRIQIQIKGRCDRCVGA